MKKYLYFLLFLILLAVFIVRFKLLGNSDNLTKNEEISGVILEEPIVKGGQQTFNIEGVEVVTRRFPEYHYGDLVKIEIANSPSQNSKLSYPKIELAERNKGNFLFGAVYNLRKQVEEIYKKTLPAREAALLSGIVLGVKSNLPFDFQNALKNTGTMHVVVASGMNVTFFTGYMLAVLRLFLNRRLAIIISFLGIIFYTILAGFQVPIIRASLMCFILLWGKLIGREGYGISILLLTVLVMLIINPLWIFDVSFQLSVLATLGLLIIEPILLLNRYLRRISKIALLGESFMTTLSAQLAVSPILLYNFGNLSLISPLVNTLSLWVVPIVMSLGIFIAIAGLIFLPIASLISYFCYGFLWYFCEVINFFGKEGWGVVQIKNPSMLIIIGYYIFLTAVLGKVGMRKRAYR